MKKVMNKITMATIIAMTSVPAFAADNKALCDLIVKMKDVFGILRTLAFVGAAFYIAGWAWGFISKGAVDVEKDLKGKGTGLLVGFLLLFMIGVLLSFVLSAANGDIMCKDIITTW